MPQLRQHASPMFLADLSAEAVGLRQASGTAFTATADSHNEAWLQDLIHHHPMVLPIAEIEPALGQLLSVCRELPTQAGFVDNLFVTPRGDIIVAECKLWRNPQARREVIAQALDYAAALSRLSYEEFERTVGQALHKDRSFRLYDMIDTNLELSESEFVDAVARNLRLGRMLLLIVGDGIREGMEALSEYLQRHAGLHFTLSLVELPVFELPVGGFVVLPRVVLKTINVERGVVTFANGTIAIEAPQATPRPTGASKRTSMSDELVIDRLASLDPNFPVLIDQFLAAVSDLGVFSEASQKSLGFYWESPTGLAFNVGGISIKGELLTDSVNWKPNEAGLIEISHRYQERLARIVGGSVRRTAVPSAWRVVQHGTTNPDGISLLKKSDAWVEALRLYISELQAAISANPNST